MSAATPASQRSLAEHFVEVRQQEEARTIGMWVYLGTEILLFGGIFGAWAVYRYQHGEAWREAAHHMDLWLGAINTAVLLLSSLTMALAVHAAHALQKKWTLLFVLATVSLGTLFLGIKAYEYMQEIHHGLAPFAAPIPVRQAFTPATELYMNLYFAATGLHAFHLISAIALLGGFILWILKSGLSADRAATLEILGLFWHLVDVVWIILYPMLYLTR
ncbi:MAG: cytochrome c oxidase subunit 3 [Sumerlaeia bacterium]